MFQKNTPRLIILGVVLLWAVYALTPTIKLQSLSPEEKASLRECGELEGLENRAIRRGLDLQGGMHIVLEVDIPTLVDNLASNKNRAFNNALEAAREKSLDREVDYIGLFLDEARARDLQLKRYYPDFGSDNLDIATRLEDEATDAINRALEILQNRIDQFGVSEPTIQKQGNRRIIVELAGIQDPERARALLESTALLEFVLLKNPEITQDMLVRIDKVVKGS